MRITVVGTGPGAVRLMTEEAKTAAEAADLVVTSERLSGQMKSFNECVEIMGVEETMAFIEEKAEEDINVCIAASGDTGFYSIAAVVGRRVPDSVPVKYISGISSLQYFAAAVKQSYDDMKLASLHGRRGSVVPLACYNRKVFLLTGGDIKAADVIAELSAAGLEDVRVHVGEYLSLPEERIVCGKPSELAGMHFSDLSVMIIVNDGFTDSCRTLDDEDFLRGNTPMTKKTVRDAAVAELEIHPGDTVYDIGAGTGAVTCTMALKASEGMVYALERNEDAAELIRSNKKHLGIWNIRVINGTAPAGLAELPPADKVFIGGSSGSLKEIAADVIGKNRQAKIVATAITLETLNQAAEAFSGLGLETDIRCLNVSAAQRCGKYTLMKAENPVYVIKGVRRKGSESVDL